MSKNIDKLSHEETYRQDYKYNVDTVKLQTLLDQLDVAIENKDDYLIKKTISEIIIKFTNDNEVVKYLMDWHDGSGLKCSIEAFKLFSKYLFLQQSNESEGGVICPLNFATEHAYNFDEIKAIIETNMYYEISTDIINNIIKINHIYCSSKSAEALELIDFLLNKDDSCLNEATHEPYDQKDQRTLLDHTYENIIDCEDEELKTFYQKLVKILLKHGAKTQKGVEEFDEKLVWARRIISRSSLLIKSMKNEKTDIDNELKLEFLEDIQNDANKLLAVMCDND